MRVWQKSMIRLARSQKVTRFMQGARCMRPFSLRFVGGSDRDGAVATAKGLRERGVAASLFFLGEYEEDEARIRATVEELASLPSGLAGAGLDVHVSVDPTQVGSMRSWGLCRDNVFRLAGAVGGRSGGGHDVLMLDMEDSSVTEKTLELYHALRDASLPAAVTIQAYLHRSAGDLAGLVDRGGMVRLVKGAFAEPATVACTGRKARDRAYVARMEQLFSPEAREGGVYPVLGTHDHRMVEKALRLAETGGWSRDQWEVEMLYGVRPGYQRELVDRGIGLRVYLPYGRDWWPYSIRRVGETPRNLRFVLRSLAG